MEFLRNLLSGPTIGIIIAIIAIVVILMTGYLKAPPDTAIIISGIGKKPRILVGRAGLRIPFFERIDRLTLKQISIDIRTEDYISTKDYINITVDAVAKVHVDMEKIAVAMTNFLNKNEEEIIADLQGTLQGNMREIIGTMYLKEICNDRSSFGNKVKESASPDMSNLGILIEDMGMDNTSKIKKDAAIAKAESERDVAIAEAQAKKAANDARVEAETQIAEKNNQLAIKQSQLKISADMKKAEADAAYKIQEQEQRRTIEVNSVNADIARQEREAELKKVEVQVTEQALDAEVKKKADAEQYAQQKRAEVELFQRQRDADAKAYEIQKEAEAMRAKAEAEKYAAEQKAAGIRTIGEAEAAAVKAKGLAEAEGIDKKAEAMRKMGEASVLEMFFKAYPEVMAAAAKPLENVGNITMYGEGNSAKLIGDIVNSGTQVISGVEQATGLDIKALLSGFLGGKLAGSNSGDDTEASDKSSSEEKPVI